MTAKIKISSKWWLAALSWAILSGCDETALRDNPFDPDGVAYNGVSSSSEVALSSSSEISSSASVGSSSSEQSLSSSSSSSLSSSSSQAESSSSEAISSSSAGGSSSSSSAGGSSSSSSQANEPSSSSLASIAQGTLWNYNRVNANQLGQVNVPLIEGLDASSAVGVQAGWWFGYNDNALGGLSTIAPLFADGKYATSCELGDCSKASAFSSFSKALYFYAKLTKGTGYSDPFAGIGFNWQKEINVGTDVEMHKGFCLAYALKESSGASLVLEMPLNSTYGVNYANPYYTLPATANWRVIQISWGGFVKADWGTPYTVYDAVVTETSGVHFMAQAATGNTVEFLLGDFGWFEDGCVAPTSAPVWP